VIFGFSIFFLPGIYFFCRFAFLPQAIVLERAGVMESWNRSWFLVDGSWWRVFRLIAAVFVLYGILLIIGITLRDALGVLGNLPDSFAGSLGQLWNAAVEILVLPIPLGVLTVLFYDLRVRKEGFDLELMAEHISGRGTAYPLLCRDCVPSASASYWIPPLRSIGEIFHFSRASPPSWVCHRLSSTSPFCPPSPRRLSTSRPRRRTHSTLRTR
jgi:hypothetical protein